MLDFETVQIIGEVFEVDILEKEEERIDNMARKTTDYLDEDDLDHLQPRPPVVVVMGHVDHGKVSCRSHLHVCNHIVSSHVPVVSELCSRGHSDFCALFSCPAVYSLPKLLWQLLHNCFSDDADVSATVKQRDTIGHKIRNL